MRTIKFSELIKMIEEGKAPKYILVDSIKYEYTREDYYEVNTCEPLFNSYRLGYLVGNKHKFEIPEEPILTDKEKEYLSKVIEPFRDSVKGIEKRSFPDIDYITIEIYKDSNMNFPMMHKNSKYYLNMEPFKIYTLEELGL